MGRNIPLLTVACVLGLAVGLLLASPGFARAQGAGGFGGGVSGGGGLGGGGVAGGGGIGGGGISGNTARPDRAIFFAPQVTGGTFADGLAGGGGFASGGFG